MIAKLLVSSNLQSRINQINLLLDKLPVNHPDVLYIKAGEKLGIGEAKKIKDHLFLKPYSAKGRVVILEDMSPMTIEAQNSLLKTLEELPEEALIILGANSEQNLLPTVISRCELIVLTDHDMSLRGAKRRGNLPTPDIEKLLNSNLEERFEYIEKLKERDELLKNLTLFWREKLLENPSSETKNFLKHLLEAEKWANQNVNIRATLEYLMLVMPKAD